MDPVSPGEQMSSPTPLLHQPLPLLAPARRRQGDLPGRQGEGKVLTETSLVMNQPRFAFLLRVRKKKRKKKKVQCQRRVPPRSGSSYQGKHWSQEICSAKHRMSMVISWRVEKRPARIPALKQGGTCAQFLHKSSRSAC